MAERREQIVAPGKTYEVTLYTPHAAQMVFHESTARFRVVCCGRRWGKTYCACNEEAKFALDHPGVLCWWVAPTARQAKIAYRLMKRALAGVLISKNDSDFRLELVNGSVIECRSCHEPDNLRGEGVHFMVIEEAAMVSFDTWFKVLRPMLSDTNGRAVFISTPKGRNWFFVMFQRGLDPLEKDYESFHFPSSSNPYLDPQEIEDAKRDMPEDFFEQEFNSAFLNESAGVFRGVDECISGSLEGYRRGDFYTLGWDPAKRNDFSVLTVMNVNRMHVVAWDRFNQVDYTVQLDRVEAMARRYHASILMDMTGIGDALLEQLKVRDLTADGYLLTNASEKALIEESVVAIQQREVTYPDLPIMTGELKAMEYSLTPGRLVRYSAPSGMHDDCVFSLCLAKHAAGKGRAIPAAATRTHKKDEEDYLPTRHPGDDAEVQKRQEMVSNFMRGVHLQGRFGR